MKLQLDEALERPTPDVGTEGESRETGEALR